VLALNAAAAVGLGAGTGTVNCFYEEYGYMYIGGNFDTVITIGGSVFTSQGCLSRFTFPANPYASVNLAISPIYDTSLTTGTVGVTGGQVYTINVSTSATLGRLLIAGGNFNDTFPTPFVGSLANIIIMTNPDGTSGTQTYNNAGDWARVEGSIETVYAITKQASSDTFAVGGAFLTSGQPGGQIASDYFLTMSVVGGPANAPLVLNQPVYSMCMSATVADSIFVAGLFTGTPIYPDYNFYYNLTTTLTSNAAPVVGSDGSDYPVVNSRAGRDIILYRGTNRVTDSTDGTTWVDLGVSGTTANPGIYVIFDTDSPPQYYTANANATLLRQYLNQPAHPAPIATFTLPSSKFRSSAAPASLVSNAVFSTNYGCQSFLSDGTGTYWSPMGAFTTGLTFT
jgi:hypothetical protein